MLFSTFTRDHIAFLRSIVLHDMEIQHVKSSFPCSLGTLLLYVRLRKVIASAAASTSTHNRTYGAIFVEFF